MKSYTATSLLQKVAEENNKHGLYIKFEGVILASEFDSLLLACPFLNMTNEEHYEIAKEGEGFFLFDDEKQRDSYMSQCADGSSTSENNNYCEELCLFVAIT